MTDNEIKILLRLNKSRSQNNVDDVLSEELEIDKYEIGKAISNLLEKGYVYEDSNTNQKELGFRAWKITRDGELKVNDLKNKEILTNPISSSINDENIKLKNDLLRVQIENGKRERADKYKILKWTLGFTLIGCVIGILPILLSHTPKDLPPTYIVNQSIGQQCCRKDSVNNKMDLISDSTKHK